MLLSIIRNEMNRQNTSVYHPKTGRYAESFRLKFRSEYIDRMILHVFSFDLVRPYDRFYQSPSRAP